MIPVPADLRVVIAPDSFKGSMTASAAADAIAGGWAAQRPGDVLSRFPQADGGEGTAELLAQTIPGATWQRVPDVPGPDGRPVDGAWLRLPDGTGVVELAQMSGITLMERLDPGIASTRGFGAVIRAALRDGARSLILCLGGSASNDGGAGALRELGVAFLGSDGRGIPDGGDGLLSLESVHTTQVLQPPPGGVRLLTDVDAPLLGPAGATAVFGPQKGVTPDRQSRFEQGLTNLARLLPADPTRPGMGAAGGTAFGLAAIWDVELVSGADHVATVTGLVDAMQEADLLITGEGRFDSQSSSGKVVGVLSARAARAGLPVAIIAGSVATEHSGMVADLSRLAGSTAAAMAEPERFARMAGSLLAAEVSDSHGSRPIAARSP